MSEVTARFTLVGFDGDSKSLSALLGTTPDQSGNRGETRKRKHNSNLSYQVKESFWELIIKRNNVLDAGAIAKEMIARCTPLSAALKDATLRSEWPIARLSLYIYFEELESRPSLCLEVDDLAFLADNGIELDIGIS